MTTTKMKASKTSTLTAAQVRILKAISEGGVTREKLEEKLGFGCNPDNLGGGDIKKHPNSLLALGLVTRSKDEGEDMTWTLTKTGVKARDGKRTNNPIPEDERIDADELDPAVIEVRGTVTYGLELWTDAEYKAVMRILGDDYAHVTRDSLKRQIWNRRKVGAFKPVFKASYPKWYAEYRQSQHFTRLAAKMVRLTGGCSINPETEVEDEASLTVVHRRFVTKDGEILIGKENQEDLLVLCPKMLEKLWKALPAIPEHDPR